MDDSRKDELLQRFRAYLDEVEETEGPADEDEAGDEVGGDSAADLFALHVELAGLRSEVRTESRLVKEALDLFRGIVERSGADRDAALREIERLRCELQDREQAVLRPLLLDLLDLRDRLAAGLAGGGAAAPWYARFGGGWTEREDAWREGLRISLARLDRLLRERGVAMMDVAGQPFDPALARAVATAADPGQPDGVVVEEIRPGFTWKGAVLRAAEVAVNKRESPA